MKKTGLLIMMVLIFLGISMPGFAFDSGFRDEIIDKVRVASTMGGKSETVHLSRSGREIRAADLMAGLMSEKID